jgi:hypothetical protein
MIKTNYKMVAGAVCAVAAAAFLNASSFAADAVPGSSDDPVVTKSYVDDKINQALGSASGGEALAFTPVAASAGQYIIGREGAEIILRSGAAAIHCPGENGVTNITNGADMPDGANLQANNLIIIPRDDGRGVKAETDAWFLIKGEYYLTNQQ